MREPTTQWMEMTARVEGFLKDRLSDELEYRLVKLALRKLLLEDQVLREDYARVLKLEGLASQLRAETRRALETRLNALGSETKLAETDTPQRLLKVCRRVLVDGEAAGKPTEQLDDLQRLAAFFQSTQNLIVQAGPARRKLMLDLQEQWKQLEEYLRFLDEIIPAEFEHQEDVLAEWQRARVVEPPRDPGPGREPRQAA